MNQEKLKMLQAQVRIGGKGTVRRKKKVVHRTATTDDKKLQSSLKKLSVNNIPGIEEVNMIKDDGTVIHFNNPKVQASLAANTFAVTGSSSSCCPRQRCTHHSHQSRWTRLQTQQQIPKSSWQTPQWTLLQLRSC